jgi:hypothetical protein
LILQKENIQENIRETEMKKSTLLVWIHVFLIVVVIASVWLIAGNDVEKAAVEKPYVLSMTASVDIPDEMTFAGEKIVFDRYDLRERMDRELNSFTYFHSTKSKSGKDITVPSTGISLARFAFHPSCNKISFS